MSPFAEAWLTCVRELRRNLRSIKGVVMGVLFLLGGGAASLIYIAVSSLLNRLQNGQPVPEEALHHARVELWTEVWGKEIGEYIGASPLLFVALFKAVWWLIPFLTLMIGFEQICGDLQHRTFRYDAIRSRRSSIVAGKALAIWMVVSLLVLALNVFVWVVTVARGDARLAEALSWGGRFYAMSIAYIATWAGMTVLVSSFTRRPVISLFIGLVVFSGIGICELATFAIQSLNQARYAFPGFYQEWLVTPNPAKVVGGLAILIAFGVAATAASAWIVNRSDV